MSQTTLIKQKQQKTWCFPKYVMDIIYEFNPIHRTQLKLALYENMINFHYSNYGYALNQLKWRVNCENCGDKKPAFMQFVPYCSNNCCIEAKDCM